MLKWIRDRIEARNEAELKELHRVRMEVERMNLELTDRLEEAMAKASLYKERYARQVLIAGKARADNFRLQHELDLATAKLRGALAAMETLGITHKVDVARIDALRDRIRRLEKAGGYDAPEPLVELEIGHDTAFEDTRPSQLPPAKTDELQ